jgi:hypothetical protein
MRDPWPVVTTVEPSTGGFYLKLSPRGVVKLSRGLAGWVFVCLTHNCFGMERGRDECRHIIASRRYVEWHGTAALELIGARA